ncbi:uncharacterized protein LAJ45_08713 [Morchella importuna]|uniref:uncharacterized protein n=1 Tax=Morchella importuna TaxID=1174673 RepID=UPI001E8D4B08|nr:uncharacterized protein LAJ45_08713 [Morchella importuna]KAH8147235.1 hypothetical protein LAJ45_08713 [Morchella importuna]
MGGIERSAQDSIRFDRRQLLTAASLPATHRPTRQTERQADSACVPSGRPWLAVEMGHLGLQQPVIYERD